MKKVLVMGGDGMLGHKVFRTLSGRFETYATFRGFSWLRRPHPVYADIDRNVLWGDVDATETKGVAAVVGLVKPDVVVNCIGLVKQRNMGSVPSIRVNSLFPHVLADLCAQFSSRLIHVSTDCVFSGDRGGYSEDDATDPVDLYGRTKLLGEVDRPGCLTLRTSLVGWEVKNRLGLLEWFAAQRGNVVEGHNRAIFNGLSTAALAGLIGDLIERWPGLSGLHHVAGESCTKYAMLFRLRRLLGWNDIDLCLADGVSCDRRLDASKFRSATGWGPPNWHRMMAGLAAEWPEYEKWRTA